LLQGQSLGYGFGCGTGESFELGSLILFHSRLGLCCGPGSSFGLRLGDLDTGLRDDQGLPWSDREVAILVDWHAV
jgi:hypothetical protein